MSTEELHELALARLLRLASPALPVGAFSYSQGLEWAVAAQIVQDADSAKTWILDALSLSLGCCEAPLFVRLYRSWASDTPDAAVQWNEFFVATRETLELRTETLNMGWSLLALAERSREFSDAALASLRTIASPSYPAVFAFLAAAWSIPLQAALTGYLWSWAENQTLAAVKAIPLGQTAAQAILAAVIAALPQVVAAALRMRDDEIENFTYGLAIASSRHETQYSRLFRS